MSDVKNLAPTRMKVPPFTAAKNHFQRLLRLWSICLTWGVCVGAAEPPRPLLIAAAADLRFALDAVLAEFRKAHPEHDSKPVYSSSGTLFAQIDNGAPFDLFLSADVKFPQQLIARGRAEKDSLFSYAIGHLVLWLPRESRLDVPQLKEKTLLDASVRKVAIANPEVAPYGAAAVAALESLGVYEAVRPKLVLGENVSQAAQFVQSGAADAGLISLSLALSPKMKDAGRYWEVPFSAFPKLEQAGVILSAAPNRAGATLLRDFLAGAAGHEILKRYGFVLPDAAN